MLACRGAAARLDSFTSTLDVMIWSPKINSWTLKMMVWFRFLFSMFKPGVFSGEPSREHFSGWNLDVEAVVDDRLLFHSAPTGGAKDGAWAQERGHHLGFHEMPSKKGDLFFGWGQDDHAKRFKNSPKQTIQNTRYLYIKLKLSEKNIPTIQQSTNRQNCSHRFLAGSCAPRTLFSLLVLWAWRCAAVAPMLRR